MKLSALLASNCFADFRLKLQPCSDVDTESNGDHTLRKNGDHS